MYDSSISAPSSATSGPAISGGGNVNFGAVNTGGGIPAWLWWVLIGAAAFIFWKPLKKLLHL
jgi:hypothetical protein